MLGKTSTFILWAISFLFVVLYPILISMYVYLPLFIGFMGYLIIWSFDGHGSRYIWFPLIYLVNLEVNLSLPLLLSFLAVIMFYLTLYNKLKVLKRCPVCIGLVSVAAIDIYYLTGLVIYDFTFDTSSIVIDPLLFYSLIFDFIFVVLV